MSLALASLASSTSASRSALPDTRILNLQADHIERVLAAHHAPARVYGGRLTPHVVQYHLTPDATTNIQQLQEIKDQVALSLGVPSVRFTQQAGRLSLEVPRATNSALSLVALDQRLSRDADLARALRVPGTAILGMDSDGIPLLLRLSSPDVTHVLVVGAAGSGRTNLVRTILASLLLHDDTRDLLLALFDSRGRGLECFSSAPHLLFPLVREPAAATAGIRQLVQEMERRERRRITRPRIVVAIDDIDALLPVCGGEFESGLVRLVQRGRETGLCIIMTTRKPAPGAIGSLLGAYLPLRIVGQVANGGDAHAAAGIAGTGAEKLHGRGDFVLVAGGQVIRFNSARISEFEIGRIIHPASVIPFPLRRCAAPAAQI